MFEIARLCVARDCDKDDYSLVVCSILSVLLLLTSYWRILLLRYDYVKLFDEFIELKKLFEFIK